MLKQPFFDLLRTQFSDREFTSAQVSALLHPNRSREDNDALYSYGLNPRSTSAKSIGRLLRGCWPNVKSAYVDRNGTTVWRLSK